MKIIEYGGRIFSEDLSSLLRAGRGINVSLDLLRFLESLSILGVGYLEDFRLMDSKLF